MNEAEAFDRAYLWHFRAKPVRVIDGDTFVVLADCGFSIRHETTIRLHNVYAPELHGKDAIAGARWKDALSAIFDRLSGEWPLRVVTVQLKTKVAEDVTFIRYVSDVHIVNDDGSLSNLAELLEADCE